MKTLEENIFKGYILDKSSLISYGFKEEENHFSLQKPLLSSDFTLFIDIDSDGEVEVKAYDEEFEYIAYRSKTLGEFSLNVKKEIEHELLQIRDACFRLARIPNVYLLPSNPKIYDVKKGFEEGEGYLNWPARKRLQEGDRVFIYSSIPFKGIAFSATVIVVDEAETNEDYFKSYHLTLLRLDKEFKQGEFTLDEALAHGLKTVRFMNKLSEEATSYFLMKEKTIN